MEQIEVLVDQYGERLLRYAASILTNYQDAEDVVQEVFITAFLQPSTIEIRNVSAWLFKITYNKSINKIKKRKILPFAEVPIQEVDRTKNQSLSDETLNALARLKPQERALIFGRIVEGYNYDELAQQMGTNAATLRKQYERAKDKFATILEEDDL